MAHPSPALSLGNAQIRQHDGLFSLNDLHRASGGEDKHRPNQFLRSEQTKALAVELGNAQIRAFETRRGAHGGTYACRELVIAYAAWISPAFHLKVIRVFLGAQVAQPAPPPRRQIRTRDDLSFTRRDADGLLVNWSVPHDRNGNWAEGVAKGEGFFDEVAELASHDEKAASAAISCALSGSFDFRRGPSTEFQNAGWGMEDGFALAIARAVIDGLRARRLSDRLQADATALPGYPAMQQQARRLKGGDGV